MKNMILGALAVAFVSSTLFAGSAHAVLTANGLTPNGLRTTNGMSGHNGLPTINGMSGHNGLPTINGMSGHNGLPTINGMSGHNGLASINGMSGHNGLAVLKNIHAARAAIWTSNGIDPSRPLSQITARR